MAVGSYGDVAIGLGVDMDFYLGADDDRINGQKAEQSVMDAIHDTARYYDMGAMTRIMLPGDVIDADSEGLLKEQYTGEVDVAIILAGMGRMDIAKAFVQMANEALVENRAAIGC